MSSGLVSVDRRGSARAPLFMLVHTAGDPLWAHDIGLGGMLCRSRAPRWPGTYLDLKFSLPGTDDALRAGAQVMTIDEIDQEMSLGVRFCMLSAKVQRAIYRFLDRRRLFWQGEAKRDGEALISPETAAGLPLLSELETSQAYERAERVQELLQAPESGERPFEKLLLEARAALRARELQRLTFIRSFKTDRLPRLSELR